MKPLTSLANIIVAVALIVPNTSQSADSEAIDLDESRRSSRENNSRWSVGFGVAIIAENEPSEYMAMDFERWNGEGNGVTFNLMASYRLYTFDLNIGRFNFRPQIEIPAMLTLVHEDKQELFPDYNIGVMLRWQDFPWNRYVQTSFGLGGGLSYSSKIWTADQLKHPGSDRSHLKFWMPIELTFALPRFEQHQLVLFVDHQSGGHCLLDCGGVDAWGAAYRFRF